MDSGPVITHGMSHTNQNIPLNCALFYIHPSVDVCHMLFSYPVQAAFILCWASLLWFLFWVWLFLLSVGIAVERSPTLTKAASLQRNKYASSNQFLIV